MEKNDDNDDWDDDGYDDDSNGLNYNNDGKCNNDRDIDIMFNNVMGLGSIS